MFKKFCVALIFTAIIFFGSFQSKTAMAADYYVGTYNSGLRAFAMTETLTFFGTYRLFEITIKVVNPLGKTVTYIHYDFRDVIDEGRYFENSQGYSGKVQKNSVEENICNYAFNEWAKKF